MKILNTSIEYISRDRLLRNKFKTQELMQDVDSYFIDKDYVLVKDIFNVFSGYAFSSSDYVSNGIPLVRISNLNNKLTDKDIVYLPEDYLFDFEKYIIKVDDILISLTGDGKMKKAYSNTENLLLNQRVGLLRAKNNVYPKLIYNLFYSKDIEKQFEMYSTGKSQLNISPGDLSRIKLPLLPNDLLIEIEKKVSVLEQKIGNLYLELDKNIDFIDEIFGNYFRYNYLIFEELKKIKKDFKKLISYSNNTDLRFSSKFHRKAGKFVYSELEKNSVKIKKALESLSITGKGITPQDFEEDTDCYYITMADISSWELDYENLKTVSKEYEDNNSTKKPKGEKVSHSTKVKVGDILMMRSGEGGIGKVALVTEEINAIFSDFLILFRFDKSKYLPQFCYYYMRTKYFQYLVEINKKGLGNHTNIFPDNTNEFPIPNISIDEQKIIVSKIEKKINEQKKIEKEIERLQEQISDIVEESIL